MLSRWSFFSPYDTSGGSVFVFDDTLSRRCTLSETALAKLRGSRGLSSDRLGGRGHVGFLTLYD